MKEQVKFEMTENKVKKLYGDRYEYTKRPGTEVDLRQLKKGESVCFGDGRTYHWLLTEKEEQVKQQPI